MIIKLNNHLKIIIMSKKNLRGGRTLVQHVLDLQKEGWQVANIASIAQVDAEKVRNILRSNGLLD